MTLFRILIFTIHYVNSYFNFQLIHAVYFQFYLLIKQCFFQVFFIFLTFSLFSFYIVELNNFNNFLCINYKY